jgi:hypothetical protein
MQANTEWLDRQKVVKQMLRANLHQKQYVEHVRPHLASAPSCVDRVLAPCGAAPRYATLLLACCVPTGPAKAEPAYDLATVHVILLLLVCYVLA